MYPPKLCPQRTILSIPMRCRQASNDSTKKSSACSARLSSPSSRTPLYVGLELRPMPSQSMA
ncbi:hypothetical protein GGH92_006211 [Coemansia sp. RSA 2673]|nr:hypothetical protein GGH92_006211 [Coemansia sp. RSA 2673]